MNHMIEKNDHIVEEKKIVKEKSILLNSSTHELVNEFIYLDFFINSSI